MDWELIWDSPLTLGLLAGIPSLITLVAGFFLGLPIGRAQAPDVLQKRLAEKHAHVVSTNILMRNLETEKMHLSDSRRSMIGAAHHLEARVAQSVNALVEQVKVDVSRLTEMADQPTEAEKAEKRKA